METLGTVERLDAESGLSALLNRERNDMEEAVVISCETCGKGSILHTETGDFVAIQAAETRRELVFGKQVECPSCKAVVELEFTIDKKTGQPTTAIHSRKSHKSGGFLSKLRG